MAYPEPGVGDYLRIYLRLMVVACNRLRQKARKALSGFRDRKILPWEANRDQAIDQTKAEHETRIEGFTTARHRPAKPGPLPVTHKTAKTHKTMPKNDNE